MTEFNKRFEGKAWVGGRLSEDHFLPCQECGERAAWIYRYLVGKTNNRKEVVYCHSCAEELGIIEPVVNQVRLHKKMGHRLTVQDVVKRCEHGECRKHHDRWWIGGYLWYDNPCRMYACRYCNDAIAQRFKESAPLKGR